MKTTVKHLLFVWPYFREVISLDLFTRHYFRDSSYILLYSLHQKLLARTLFLRLYALANYAKIKSSRTKSVLQYISNLETINAKLVSPTSFTLVQYSEAVVQGLVGKVTEHQTRYVGFLFRRRHGLVNVVDPLVQHGEGKDVHKLVVCVVLTWINNGGEIVGPSYVKHLDIKYKICKAWNQLVTSEIMGILNRIYYYTEGGMRESDLSVQDLQTR